MIVAHKSTKFKWIYISFQSWTESLIVSYFWFSEIFLRFEVELRVEHCFRGALTELGISSLNRTLIMLKGKVSPWEVFVFTTSLFEVSNDIAITWRGVSNSVANSAAKISTCDRKRKNISVTQCENVIIFLSLRFYVKSIFGILEVQKLPILVNLVNSSLQKVQNSYKIRI